MKSDTNVNFKKNTSQVQSKSASHSCACLSTPEAFKDDGQKHCMPRHCRNIARTLLRLKSRMYELEAEDVDEDEDEDGHDSLTRLRPRSMRKLVKLRARIWELEAADVDEEEEDDDDDPSSTRLTPRTYEVEAEDVDGESDDDDDDDDSDDSTSSSSSSISDESGRAPPLKKLKHTRN